jgi:hypothetical protein
MKRAVREERPRSGAANPDFDSARRELRRHVGEGDLARWGARPCAGPAGPFFAGEGRLDRRFAGCSAGSSSSARNSAFARCNRAVPALTAVIAHWSCSSVPSHAAVGLALPKVGIVDHGVPLRRRDPGPLLDQPLGLLHVLDRHPRAGWKARGACRRPPPRIGAAPVRRHLASLRFADARPPAFERPLCG